MVFGLIFSTSIIFGAQDGGAITLLNTSNANSTTNNSSSILNSTNQNATIPNTIIDSIPEDENSGSIASIPILPGKCLGSALCPD